MRHEQKYLVIPAGLGEASGEEASQFSAPGSSTHGSEPSLGLSMPLSEYGSGYEESEGEKRTCFSWSEERMRASNEVLGGEVSEEALRILILFVHISAPRMLPRRLSTLT